MKLRLHQKVLLSVGVLGAVGALAGSGVFATFTAQTTNPTNKFATGTLVLSNTVDAGTACLSTGGGTTDVNSNSACDTAFSLAVQAPGDNDTADLTLANVGSLAATALKVFSTCANGDAAGENYHGTGLPCAKIQIYVQQYSDNFTTESACLYGGATGNVCDFSDVTKTLATFATTHANVGSGLGAGALAAAGGADTTWIRVGIQLPTDADNAFQGRTATMALNWHVVH